MQALLDYLAGSIVYRTAASPFFFQAEDGIRDHCVTGVQTCALPIFPGLRRLPHARGVRRTPARRSRAPGAGRGLQDRGCPGRGYSAVGAGCAGAERERPRGAHASAGARVARLRQHDHRSEIGLRARSRERAQAAPRHPRNGGRGARNLVCAEEGRHERRADYVRLVCEEMIPAVARQHLATACDVFCEPGVFDIAETRTILTAAQRHGLRLKLHADELEGSGGAELAAALGALSADHLAAISDAGIRALAASDTVAVLLPATMVFLGRRAQAPARRLVDAGAAVALATDFNPRSSPTVGLPLVMALGVSQLGLRHAEVVSAVTVNAAAALGLAADRGQIASGFRADLVSWSVSDWREVAYWMGGQLVTAVWTGGSACPLPAGPVSLGLHVKA